MLVAWMCATALHAAVERLGLTNETGFPLVTAGRAASIVVPNDAPEVVRTAARDFAADVEAVTGVRPRILDSADAPGPRVEVGFDPALSGHWEAYRISATADVLIVAGSDGRALAFGLYELSRRIGVSPWYWWADVPVARHETLRFGLGTEAIQAPAVRYRGIFLNDEDWGLQPWAAKTFEPETGDIGPKTYGRIFELLLRLKANAIWPAMHPCTRAFFTYPGNIEMANRYGIWVGSSHCEPMLRNNVDEWKRWSPGEGERGSWNFDENPDQITRYWQQRVEETARYNGIYTVGMRGIHDGSMPGGKTIDDKLNILGRVLQTQRQLLTDITGKPVTTIPQIFCPYKEVLELYRAGAAIPDDVTIMWADDNHGYIRQLSNLAERGRSGGSGVYYHLSYWGRPHDYLWLESTPVSLIWEEMHKAYQADAKRIWIGNVGDIKPNEISMNFFLDMAWDPNRYDPDALESYYTHFAETQFGPDHAVEIGEILARYFALGFSRKPEHMGWTTVYPNTPIQDPELSLFNYGDEVQQRIDAYDQLEGQVEALYDRLPDPLKDAFFELVSYKVIGAANMNKKLLYAYKSRAYAQQGRTSANDYARKAQMASNRIKAVTATYNDQIAGGKWKHMMSDNPRQLPVFGMPETAQVDPSVDVQGGVVPEGYADTIQPDADGIALPMFDGATDRRYFVDVFNSGRQPTTWSAGADQPWVLLSATSGETETQTRLWVSIDWDRLPEDAPAQASLMVTVNDQQYPLSINAVNRPQRTSGKPGFVEENGVVSMEAEQFARATSSGTAQWKRISGLGRLSDAVGSFPVTAESFAPDTQADAPSLAYDFHATTGGEANIYFYCLPNQPINADYQLRFSVCIDGGPSEIVNAALKREMHERNAEWQRNVLRAVTIPSCKLTVPGAGQHVLKVTMVDPGVVLDKVEIVFGERKASYFGAPETANAALTGGQGGRGRTR